MEYKADPGPDPIVEGDAAKTRIGSTDKTGTGAVG